MHPSLSELLPSPRGGCRRLRWLLPVWMGVLILGMGLSARAQGPLPLNGQWSGSVTVRRSFPDLEITHSSTHTVSGLFVAGDFAGILTSLQGRENLDDALAPQSLYRLEFTHRDLSVENALTLSLGRSLDQALLSLVPGSYRVTRIPQTFTLTGLSFRLSRSGPSGNQTRLEDRAVVEVSVNLKWKKALPIAP